MDFLASSITYILDTNLLMLPVHLLQQDFSVQHHIFAKRA